MQCQNNLKQIGLGLANYESSNRRFPVARNPYPLVHSSLSRLLPYLEAANALSLVDYRVNLSTGPNPQAAQTCIPVFVCPSDGRGGQVPGQGTFGTNYVANNGTGTVAYGLIASGDGVFTQTNVRTADITDGLSNTAMFAESTLGNARRRP